MRKLLERPRAVAGLSLSYIDADTRLFHARDDLYSLHLLDRQEPGRAQAEAFIRNAYQRVFNADLKGFYPGIVTLRSLEGSLEGACGVCYAASQPLFLEQYLEEAAELRLAAMTGRPAAREDIVELGNLSVNRPALTYPFMNLIGSWLHSFRVEWMVFSLTSTLRRLFERSGVEMHELGIARQSCLAPDATDWGTYYTHDPKIMAINLTAALGQFRQKHPTTRRDRHRPLVAIRRSAA